MLKRKAMLYAVILCLISFTACTKQDIVPTSTNAVKETSSQDLALQNLESIQGTISGLIKEKTNKTLSPLDAMAECKADMTKAGIGFVRIPIFLSKTTKNSIVDKYLAEGYYVQINANWNEGVNGYRPFPTPAETSQLRSQAEAFFKYYAPYKDQIPFIVVENEWDYQWEKSRAVVKDYITELAIITEIGHQYGFKIADGGITSNTLQRWTYSQLTGTQQQQWKQNYYVGLANNYDTMVNMVNEYIAGAKNIDFDYSNVHWYNAIKCGNGFGTAAQTFMNACNKTLVACNEFGIKTNSLELFNATLAEMRGVANYVVAYSGINAQGLAIMLTDEMLAAL